MIKLNFRRCFLVALAALTIDCALAAENDMTTPAAPPTGPRVILKTNMGNIVLELYPDKAPKTVNNFLRYVKEGFYKGTIFHRVISDFMIQGGGYDKKMGGKPVHAPIENEAKNGLKNETYTIAMARESFPHSATSQFFINVNDNYPLDYPYGDGWGYCVFGKVVEGMDVVDKIKLVKTTSQSVFENLPIKPVIVESASVVAAVATPITTPIQK